VGVRGYKAPGRCNPGSKIKKGALTARKKKKNARGSESRRRGIMASGEAGKGLKGQTEAYLAKENKDCQDGRENFHGGGGEVFINGRADRRGKGMGPSGGSENGKKSGR